MARASFGLDRVRVEHRSLGPEKAFACILPPPISVNAMYGQSAGRQRFNSPAYTAWIADAIKALREHRPPNFAGEVWVRITYSNKCRFDTDNAHKGILDLLTKQGVIVNDTKKYVRELRLRWGDNEGALVEVFPHPFEMARAA